MITKIDWSGRSHDFTKLEQKYLLNVIKNSDILTQGPELQKFESELQRYIKKKNIYAVSSAAAALELISILLDLKKNDEVIIPAHTYCASAIPFARNGAKIVWADIDLNTRTIDISDVKKKINKRTKAIVIVHLYGFAVDVKSFIKLKKNKNIKIIEDCAQAFGAQINGQKVGSIGDFSAFSFHAQKNITTLGEGGAVYCRDNNLAKKIKGLRHNGHSNFKKKRKKYWKPAMGNLSLDIKNQWPYKFTLSEIQSAAGHLLLKRLDKLNKKRIFRAKKIINSLSIYKEINFLASFKNKRHVYHLLTAYIDNSKGVTRDKLIERLFNKYGIKCIVQYYPLYRYDLFKKMGLGKFKCPNTDKFYDNMVSFPFHIWMSDKKFKYMINSIKKTINYLRTN